ncbi:glutamine synthetase [Actinomyces sp. Chiba101]|uniref:Glutamine synthetase n=1 Tax=Actinomyces denticolens TaxID=52767 RepID=A0ABY1IDM7_9ACTO|nr:MULTISPECIES: type I glutamate--ammonia ligase [Actinomyces]BAW93258.1 glutamine synthetase [Actinomyces sp. Chiba101]GAV95508.1 glutamine synthetase [Actinomyces denticolens]SHJ02529.1 glutamine synthetase [Actinomyces denticolens]SUU04045.1 Probable glutamine synthetase 2 [Actinomyces denticolens]
MDKQQEYVLRAIEERDVRFVRLWFTDVLGQLKSVAIAPAEVEAAFEEGIGFDGSTIEGLTRVYESDMLLSPDPSTFQMLPWRNDRDRVARMFCSVLTPDGEPARTDPRAVLERQLARVADAGFTCYIHPEIEFYLVNRDEQGRITPTDDAGYFDHVPGGTAHDFRRRAILMLEQMGISVEFSHHEGGLGQNEIDLRFADALSMADNIMTFRAVIEEVAIQEGCIATFMPKPFVGQPGSGMHTHFSLFEGDHNAFYDPAGQYQLSATGRAFIAGILRHAKEITAITNQYVNSYKRLWGGDEAPSYVCWGHNNRSALVRVPMHKPGKAQAVRVEYRSLDPAANPYLAFATILAAGMKGIEEGYGLPAETEDDVWALTDGERDALGIEALPTSLKRAVSAMSGSDLVADTLGEDTFEYFRRNKRHEYQAYDAQVTDFEIGQFFRRS